jgi:hypothetical protein
LLTPHPELCLSVKTNPYAYDYDSADWFPVVRPVAGVETKAKLEDGPFSSDDEKTPLDELAHVY